MTQDDMNRQFIIGALYPDIIREQQHLIGASMDSAIKGDKNKVRLYSEAFKILVEKAEKLYEQREPKKEKERAFWEKYVKEHPITDKDLFEQSLIFSRSIAPLRNPDEIVKSLQKETTEEQALKPLDEILKKIISNFGIDIYKDKQRLKASLDDLVMGKQNLKKLYIAIKEGIPEKLLSYNNKNNDDKHFVMTRCINQLEEDYGISKERAIETVNYLALGLGWNNSYL